MGGLIPSAEYLISKLEERVRELEEQIKILQLRKQDK